VGLAGGLNHYCALRSDGTVWCWGDNDHGQLGNGTTNFSRSPVEVIDSRFNSPLSGVSAIYAGWNSSCASHPLLTGETMCWGEDNKDKLSISSQSVDQLNPAFSTRSVKQVAIGEFHACFLFPDGTDSCNGESSVGELGTGLNVSNGVATAVGDGHSCALLANGSARCWGIDNHGELGDGSPSPISSVPVVVSGISGSVSAMAVSAGYAHTCATRANGTISCWGDNGSGQLGDGTIMDRYVPTAVMGIGNVFATVAGEFHSCALIADGTVLCWGSNNAGQLGDGTFSSHHTPKPVPNLSGVVALAAGRNHTCAVTSDYAVLCWGEGKDGEIGDGTNVDRPNPTTVISVTLNGVHNGAALSVAAGDQHTCALLVGGQMKCWGSNPDGRLGDGTDFDRPAPALVQISDATAIAAGSSQTCALRSSGLAQCWGFNLGGQLGDGTQNTRVLPTNVSGLTLAAAIAADGAHTCALIATGGTRCWGDNSDGEVGDGTNPISLLPVDIGVNRGITISAGHDHTCATWDFGALSCWGGNFNGQVGDGTTMDRFRPTSIPSFTLNIVPAVQLIDSRRATVTLLVNCPAEGTFEVAVTLTEGDAQGFGVTAGRCELGLHTYPLTVRANKSTFSVGAGDVAAQGFTVVEGMRTEQSWRRAVQIQ